MGNNYLNKAFVKNPNLKLFRGQEFDENFAKAVNLDL